MIFAWTLAGAAVFVGLYYLATHLNAVWLSFPIFCIAMLALGYAGGRIRQRP
jgi:hypothetical protein